MTTEPGESARSAQVGLVMAGVARSGAASLLGSGVSAVCQLLVVLVTTRFYSPAEAGALFAATAAFLIVVALVQVGADQGLVRFVAWHRARGEHAQVQHAIRIGLLPMVVASLVGAGALFLLAGPVSSLFSADSAELVGQMLRVLAATVPIAALHEVLLAGTRGFGGMRPTILVERILRPALQPVAIVAVALAGAEASVLALAWAAPYAVAVVLSGIALRRLARSSRVAVDATTTTGRGDAGSPRGSLTREFWRFALARGAARVCHAALQRVDVILVATLVGTSAAAVYTAATRFIALGQLVNQAVQQVIQPRLASMLSRHERASAEDVVRQSTLWLTALAWPGYLTLVVLAPTLMSVFGPSYTVGASTVVVLALAMMFATATGPVDVVLLMAGRSGPSLATVVLALVLDVVGCLLLVPPLGIFGAAVAWAVAIVTRNLVTLMLTRRLVNISAWSRELGVVSACAVGCLAVVQVPLALLDPPRMLLVASVAVGAAAYAALLWQLRRRTGLDVLVSLVRRPRGDTEAACPLSGGADADPAAPPPPPREYAESPNSRMLPR